MNVVALALLAGLAADVNLAGSVFLNQASLFATDANSQAAGATMRGMNAEASVKLVVDVSEHMSASAKIC